MEENQDPHVGLDETKSSASSSSWAERVRIGPLLDEETATSTTAGETTTSTTTTLFAPITSTTREPEQVIWESIDAPFAQVGNPALVKQSKYVPPQRQGIQEKSPGHDIPQQPYPMPCFFPFVCRAPEALLHAHKLAQLSDTLA